LATNLTVHKQHNNTMSNDKPITITYPSGKLASQVVDLLVRKRPVGWSRKSYATYYRQEYALQLKKELDNMIETNKDKVFRVENQPRLSMNSIYLFVNQAFHFLMDNGPDAEKYRDLWKKVRVERIRGTAVCIRFRDFATDVLRGEDFVSRDDRMKWKKDIDNYLNDDSAVEPLHIEHLLLSPEDIQNVKSELEGLETIQFSVTSKEIKIIKTI